MPHNTFRQNSSLMITKLVEITPEDAEKIMEKNKSNRPISPGTVRAYAKSMRNGKFIPTHQGIAIDEDGYLIDGQHRLRACTESKIPLLTFVTTNVPHCAHTDTGRKRSASDGARLMGHDWINRFIVATINQMNRTSDTRDVNDVIEIALPYQKELELVHKHMPKGKYLAPATVSAALTLALINGCPEEFIVSFCEILDTGIVQQNPGDETVIRFRDKLKQGNKDNNQDKRAELVRLTQRVFKAYVDGQRLLVLRAPDYLLFPLPKPA